MFIHVEMCINTTSHLHIKHPNWPQLLLQKGSKKRAWNILLPNSQIFDDSIWRLISSLFFFFFVLNRLPRKEKKEKREKLKYHWISLKFPFCCFIFLAAILASLMAQRVKNLPAMQETQQMGFDPWIQQILWRRKWIPTPVFLPENSNGQRSLVAFSLWGCKRVRHDWVYTLDIYLSPDPPVLYFIPFFPWPDNKP